MTRFKLPSYYMNRPGDGAWARLKNRLTRRAIPSFPRTIQIQTITGCNADCIFCPYGETYRTQPRGKMQPELFRRIVDEAAEHGVRRLSPYLMNEPLMDRELFDKLRYVKQKMPRCKIVLTSNGHFLTPDVVDALLDMGDGVHKLYISLQGIDKGAYEKTMRGNVDFERTMANVDHFIEMQRRRGLDRPELWVTMVDTEAIDARKAVAYWQSRGVNSKYTTLENRGGNIKHAEALSQTKTMSFYTSCTRLFKQAYIMFNGDLVLCCVDYSRRQVLGNIIDSSISEVWNGPVAREIRRLYLAREFDRLPLCGSCKIDMIREVEFHADGRQVIADMQD